MSRLSLFFGSTFLLIIAQAGVADVYRWVDDEGHVHFGDTPPSTLETERLELRVDEPDPNDEGELRRMRLLEQADRDAAARLKRKDQVRRLDQNKNAQETSEKAYCLKLRRQLYVLQKQMPVYRDEKGEFRVRWQRDSYQGEREYLDDATRATEIGWIHQELKTKCPNPNDVQKQRAARNRQILSARCEAARAELEVMGASLNEDTQT